MIGPMPFQRRVEISRWSPIEFGWLLPHYPARRRASPFIPLDWPLLVSFLRNCRLYFVSQGDYVNITRSRTQTIERWSALSLILVTWAMHVMDCNRVYYDVKMERNCLPSCPGVEPFEQPGHWTCEPNARSGYCSQADVFDAGCSKGSPPRTWGMTGWQQSLAIDCDLLLFDPFNLWNVHFVPSKNHWISSFHASCFYFKFHASPLSSHSILQTPLLT